MISVGLSRRYARALLSLSQRRGDLDRTNEELSGVAALFARDVRVRRFFETPNVARAEKLAFLDREWRPKVGPTLYGLLMVLLRRRRLDHLVSIAEEFHKMSERAQGIVRATVRSAVPFDDAQAARLAAALGTRSGLRVLLTRETDPAVIGGAVVSMDNQVIDGTLATEFWRIRRQLLQARVHG
ncbi:MAG TPA: ATP synthase F1 subunit delta [Candidatus Eisenbacteria bacterium]|nr:ATP synthase F1 subunit delta [Candidatus Eisenbacteria bacterium]